jgi:hypothetical protein
MGGVTALLRLRSFLSHCFLSLCCAMCVILAALWVASDVRSDRWQWDTFGRSPEPAWVRWTVETGRGSLGFWKLTLQSEQFDSSGATPGFLWTTDAASLPALGPAENTFWRRHGFG